METLPKAVLDLLKDQGFKEVGDHWEQDYYPGTESKQVMRVSKLKLFILEGVWTIHITDSEMECVVRFKNMTPFRFLNYLLKFNLHQL